MRAWCLAGLLFLAATSTASGAAPILDPLGTTLAALPGCAGRAVAPRPPLSPQNPYMAPTRDCNLHNDTWMTDAYAARPARERPSRSRRVPPALCGSLTFDSKRPIVTVCPSRGAPAAGAHHRPRDARGHRHVRPAEGARPAGQNTFQNFTGGGYFFLDAKDRIWIATKTSHLFVIAGRADGKRYRQDDDYDLTGVLEEDERVTSALPDFDGRIWFVSKKSGKVGILDPKNAQDRVDPPRRGDPELVRGRPRRASTSSPTSACTASAPASGKPKVDWKVKYDNSGIHKPSQVNAGSGTTPTITNGGYVAITDNADPMKVVVYRTATKLKKGQKRTVCEVPVFRGRQRDRELADRRRPLVRRREQLRLPGPVRPERRSGDHDRLRPRRRQREGHRLRKVWRNTDRARAVGRAEALDEDRPDLHLHAGPDAAGVQPYLGGDRLPHRQDRVEGLRRHRAGFNNNYAGIAIGPDGSPTWACSAGSSGCATAEGVGERQLRLGRGSREPVTRAVEGAKRHTRRRRIRSCDVVRRTRA